MRSDSIKEFERVRKALLKERKGIETKLAAINEALGTGLEGDDVAHRLHSLSKGKRIKNSLSLREAVRQVTENKALTKNEILTEVEKLGYKFTSDNPVNSLNTVLYSNKQFKNDKGRFRPAKRFG